MTMALQPLRFVYNIDEERIIIKEALGEAALAPTAEAPAIATAKEEPRMNEHQDVADDAMLKVVKELDGLERHHTSTELEHPQPPPPLQTNNNMVVQQESLPGAFPQRSVFATASEESTRSIVWGDHIYGHDPESQAGAAAAGENHQTTNNPTANNEAAAGLVEAEPVTSFPTETAQPLQELDGKPTRAAANKQQQQKLVGGFLILLVLAAVLIGVSIYLGPNKNNRETTSTAAEASDTTVMMNVTTTPPQTWTWDLPFTVPNATLEAIRQDNKSPQSLAYQWIKKDPNLWNYTEERLIQRFALATFYYATGGPNWAHQGGGTVSIQAATTGTGTAQSSGGSGSRPNGGGTGGVRRRVQTAGVSSTGGNGGGSSATRRVLNITSEPWLSYNTSECDWFSTVTLVGGGGRQSMDRVVCDNNQSLITELSLFRNNLQGGSLPAELGLLAPALREIDLGMNYNLQSPLQPLMTLTNLEALRFTDTDLTGTIPSQFGLLSSLTHVSLGENQLSGTIPREFWYKKQDVKYLLFSTNKLTGTLPQDLGSLMHNLQRLFLARNQFTGSLPTSIGLLTNLMEVIVHDNPFTGTIPTEIGLLTNLKTLYSKNNQFSGTLPSELGLLTSKLVGINFQGNANLTGTLPWGSSSSSIATNDTMIRLRTLNIQGTAISGTIPEILCQSVRNLRFDCHPTLLCGCNCSCGGGGAV